VVRSDSPAKTIKDLRGRRVAIPSRFAVDHLFVRRMLKEQGMTPRLGRWRWAWWIWPARASCLNPLVQGLRPISPIAWIPLAILWFGVGELSPIFLIFLSSFFPMVVGTAAGVMTIDGKYRRRPLHGALSRVRGARRGAGARDRRRPHACDSWLASRRPESRSNR